MSSAGGGHGGVGPPFSPVSEQLHYGSPLGQPGPGQDMVGEGDIITFAEDMHPDSKSRKRKSFDKSKCLSLECTVISHKTNIQYSL